MILAALVAGLGAVREIGDVARAVAAAGGGVAILVLASAVTFAFARRLGSASAPACARRSPGVDALAERIGRQRSALREVVQPPHAEKNA